MGKIHDALQRAEEERAGIRPVDAIQPTIEHNDTRIPAGRLGRRAQRRERVADARRSRVIMQDLGSRVTEEFRSLRARIQSLRRTSEIRSIVVTSAMPGEGKTNTATNLALSFGLEFEGLTCLVDADLRAPAVHKALHETPEAGLAEMLEADAKLEQTLISVPDTRLSVLAVRALPTHPSELLASRRMVELMDELYTRFTTVIVDAPPIIGLPDATALVDLCDSALIVIAAGRTPRQQIEAALDRIDARKVLGTVFNRFDSSTETYGAYGRS